MKALTRPQARRIALAAQGLGRPHPATVTQRHIAALVSRLGLVQIDSVNVVERAHLVPFYSRLGNYDRALVQRALGQAPRKLFEAWAHEASVVGPEVYHLLEWRRAGAKREAWGRMREVLERHPELVANVRQLIADHGPMTSSQTHQIFEQRYPGGPPENWGWNWTPSKAALEWLFFTGQVAACSRNASFARLYDLTDRVVPPRGDLPTDHQDQITALVDKAAQAQGVATAASLRDYFRLPLDQTRQAIDHLVDQGRLTWTELEQSDCPWLVHTAAARPRQVNAQALLTPFDPLLFDRDRLEAIFGMRFRLEFYVPKAKRVHGYYVMPFLLGDQLVARVDLKVERRAGTLVVKAAFLEPGHAADDVAAPLRSELTLFATWLGVARVEPDPAPRGDLTAALF